MAQPLFIQPKVEFEKFAGEVALPEDPNVWPKEILDELYKQVPYIADFRPHVVMTKVDAEQMYGFGHVEISNQSEAQMGTSPEQLQAAGIRTVRIPVVIKDGKLSPFDLIVNDAAKCLPLTEARLRQSLFRPQAFDITSKTPGDHSLIGALYPPFRQNYGFGGGGVVVPGDMGKMSSATEEEKTASVFEEALIKELEKGDAGFRRPKEKTASAAPRVILKTGSVLKAIAPSINQGDLNRFWEKLAEDQGLVAAYRANGMATADVLAHLATIEPVTTEKLAWATKGLIQPNVVQVSRKDGGYQVKTACSRAWRPEILDIARRDIVRRFGEKIAMDVDLYEAVTIADGASAIEGKTKKAAYSPVSTAGVYKVLDDAGKELVGYVIPNLLDVDGTPLPLALFTNGSQATVQSEVFGELAGAGSNLPVGPPTGHGAFFEANHEGGIRATIPMILSASHAVEGGPATMVGETYDGRPVEVSVQPGIQEPTGTPEGKLIIPEHWKWTPMDQAAQVALAGGGEEEPQPEATEAEAEKAGSYVTVRSSGDTFSFEGPAVEKLAYEDRNFLDIDGAMFLLAGLGVHQAYGATKLAHATTGHRPERVLVGRQIELYDELWSGSQKTAAVLHAQLPQLKKDLMKEAAFIPDPTAVDTVLSIGFINPENLMTFVSYLPSIDDSQTKLCELLLAARLGMQDVSASALERAVRSLEEVIEGLKVIAFQGV